MTDKQLTKSREYQALVIKDFRHRVYPLALASAMIFVAAFIINVSGIGKEVFVIPDLITASLFILVGILVQQNKVPPYIGSLFILLIILLFYVIIIIFGLYLLDLINIKALQKEYKFKPKK